MFIAHRGNDSHTYRENSEQAILYSLRQAYISGIECDLRLTKDNQIVLLHNMLLDFVSDGSGFVYKKTLAELLTYQFSYHGKIDEITVLSTLLSKIHSSKILLLEIKEEHERSDAWIEALSKILKKYSSLSIYLCSFNYELLKKIKNTFPEIPVGLIIGYKMNVDKELIPFDFIMYQYNSFKYTHKTSMVWTVNNKALMETYKTRVDYIVTDVAYQFV